MGARVLCVDLDSQCNLTKALHGTAPGVLDAMTHATPAGECISGGGIMSATSELARADSLFSSTPRREYLLRNALESVRNDYDFIIIDTPAALGLLSINALTACDQVIVTTSPEEWSSDGLELLAGAINAARTYTNRTLTVAGILITMNFPRATFCKDMRTNLEAVAKRMQTRVFNTAIGHSVRIKESNFLGVSIFDHAPTSKPAIEYAAFVDELLNT